MEEKSLITPGYFGSSKDNIMIMHNFVEENDINKIEKLLKKKYTFEQLCKTPELASEVALGPVKEFDFDFGD